MCSKFLSVNERFIMITKLIGKYTVMLLSASISMFSVLASAQMVQLNGVATTCTAVAMAPINGGFNIIPTPANCLGVGGNPQQPTTPFAGQITASIQGTATVAEGSTVNIPVMLLFNGGALPANNTFVNAVAVTFTTGGGTAVSGTNYVVGTASPLTIQSGFVTGYIQVTAVNDNMAAGNKTFNVTLTGLAIQGNNAGGATTALGQTTVSTVTIADAAAPGGDAADTDINGAAIPNPSLTATPQYGGNAGVNAYKVSTNGCNTTPALTALYEHQIKYPDFLTKLVPLAMSPNEAFTYKFTVPANAVQGKTGLIAMLDNSYGTRTSDFLTISEARCDFDATKIPKPGGAQPFNFCYMSAGGNGNMMYYIISSTLASHNYRCILRPGKTYYINYRFQNAIAAPNIDACAAMGNNLQYGKCATTIQIQ